MIPLPTEAPQVEKAGGAMRRLDYMPRTFAQLGAVVPFTTRILSQSRIRRGDRTRANGENLAEALLPGFAGGNSIYVTSLASLGEVVTMSVHDRALAKRITEKSAFRPFDIMACWCEIAATGLAGAKATETARLWQQAVSEAVHNDRIYMLQCLAAKRDVHLPPPLIKQLRTSAEGERALLSAIRGLEDGKAVDAGVTGQNLLDLSDVLAGVGLRHSAQRGYMRDQTWQLGELSAMLQQWGRDTMSDFGPSAVACGDAAGASFDEASKCLEKIDLATMDIPRLLSTWPKGRVQIQGQVDRLFWIMDGWDYIISLWQGVATRKMTAEDAITEIYRVLPILPPDEILGEQTVIGSSSRDFSKKNSSSEKTRRAEATQL